MNRKKAKLLDKILLKFIGNKSVKWSDLQQGIWNDIESYHVCENNINFLIGDQMLERNHILQTLSLTDKGFATMTDLENLGYVKKAIRERNEILLKYFLAFITIATFIILCLKTFIWENYSKRETEIEPSKINLKQHEILEEGEISKQLADSILKYQDTIIKYRKKDSL
jgi:hypothetical protein